MISSIRVIDSHTGGEPTRLVLEGGPDLGDGPLADRVQRFKERYDDYRCAIVNEPRGSDPLVGALLVKPQLADCDLGMGYAAFGSLHDQFFRGVEDLGIEGHGFTAVYEHQVGLNGVIALGSFAGLRHNELPHCPTLSNGWQSLGL